MSPADIIPFPLPTQEADVHQPRRFHFPAGTPRADAEAVIAAALDDEGLRLLPRAHGGRLISVREDGQDVFVIPASRIEAAR